MVLLHFMDKQKDKIDLLNSFDESIVSEFCRISAESIQKEISVKVLNTAAQKLGIQVQDLKDLIELLTWILVESSKLNLNEKELKDSCTLVGIMPQLTNEIEQTISSNKQQIQHYLNQQKIETCSFHDLEWRFDIKLATRSTRKIIEPEIILKFDFTDSKDIKTRVITTDVSNLNHLTNSLEDALNEIKNNYCRRVLRSVV